MARLLCLGFSAVDYLSENEGPASGSFLGGSAANVAAILASYGHATSYAGMVGDGYSILL
jgi:sugar/nucleoside kinase (ribokinase family)